MITKQERCEAAEMLQELRTNHFEVVLIPAPERRHEGHCLRVVHSFNPRWYSELCAQYQSLRGRGRKRMKRPRTYIKRCNTERALQALAEGRITGAYTLRILDYIREERLKTKVRESYNGSPEDWAQGLRF